MSSVLGTGFAATSLIVAIAALVFSTYAVTVSVNPQVTVDTKAWHLAHESEAAGDWLGPFYLRGERAQITWTIVEGVAGPVGAAELCDAETRGCEGLGIAIGEVVVFDLRDGAFPEEGWHVLTHTEASSLVKAVVVYLYY